MRPIQTAEVVARVPIAARMRRLTLAGADLVGLRTRPAQDLEVLLTEDGREVKRRYTIRHARPVAGEVDLDILVRDDGGPGSRWAGTAQVGEPVRFIGPRGKMQLRAADWYLFAGDEASLPAIAALSDALDGSATTYVLAEVDGDGDRVPVSATHLRWIVRQDQPPGTPGPLAETLARLDPPGGVGQAYLLGESRAMNALRGHLPRLGVTAERTFVKGYWNADHHRVTPSRLCSTALRR